MPFAYNKYRICRSCGWLGALSNHGRNAGKVAGHYNSDCPKRDILWTQLPYCTPGEIRKHRYGRKKHVRELGVLSKVRTISRTK